MQEITSASDLKNKKEAVNEYYTAVGDGIDGTIKARGGLENAKTYACKSSIDKQTRFFVKVNARGQLVDPFNDFYSKAMYFKNNIREVNKECFDHYIKFLNTRNFGWLKQARKLHEFSNIGNINTKLKEINNG